MEALAFFSANINTSSHVVALKELCPVIDYGTAEMRDTWYYPGKTGLDDWMGDTAVVWKPVEDKLYSPIKTYNNIGTVLGGKFYCLFNVGSNMELIFRSTDVTYSANVTPILLILVTSAIVVCFILKRRNKK